MKKLKTNHQQCIMGNFKQNVFQQNFKSIMEVSKLPWLQKKKITNEKNIFHR